MLVFLSVVSKVSEKLVNNRIVDHWEKCCLFVISSMVLGLLDQLQNFSQLHLIEWLGLLKSLGLLELWHLIYSRLLTGFGMLVYFTKLSLMEFQVRYLALFLLFSVIDCFKWFWKSSQEYPVNAGVPQGFIDCPILFLLYIDNLPDIICDIAINADNSTRYSKCDHISDLWQ